MKRKESKEHKKKKQQKKNKFSSAYHHRHLQLPHGGARDMMSASAAAGTGRKREHELVSSWHRLPHIHTCILLLLLLLSLRRDRMTLSV